MPGGVAPSSLELDVTELGPLGDVIGTGGQARVVDLPGFRLPDVSGPLVYKRYKQPLTSSAGLDTIVSTRPGLSRADRDRLDAMTTWPLRIVAEQGAVHGIVMPRISTAYVDDVHMPGTGDTRPGLREVQNLFIDPDTAQWLGRPVPSGVQRLQLCRDFAAVLMFLHQELNFVFGDISATNEVFRLDTQPMVMFLDCDGLRRPGSVGSTDQLNTPDWIPPEGSGLTEPTDLYKLGLFILRCLTPGPFCSTSTDPARALSELDAEGGDLLRRALSTDPQDRPSAAEWHRRLSIMLGEPVNPPTIRHAALDRQFVCTGQPVTVTWEAENATSVEAITNVDRQRADGGPGSGAISVSADRTCFVLLRVHNDLGTAEELLGPVTVVEAPRLGYAPVLMPELPLPEIDTVTRPDLVLPPVPVLDLPLVPGRTPLSTTGQEPPREPFWPDLLSTRCPLDVATLMTTAPEIDFGLSIERKGTT
jgi:hypothetical protein